MTYMVETIGPYAWNGVEYRHAVSRVAAASLEEARDRAHAAIGPSGFGWQVIEHRSAVDELPESGGTIGPLPDGTIIEVRPTA